MPVDSFITVFIQCNVGLENKLIRAPLLGLAKSIYYSWLTSHSWLTSYSWLRNKASVLLTLIISIINKKRFSKSGLLIHRRMIPKDYAIVLFSSLLQWFLRNKSCPKSEFFSLELCFKMLKSSRNGRYYAHMSGETLLSHLIILMQTQSRTNTLQMFYILLTL